jgi:hypothetical protein
MVPLVASLAVGGGTDLFIYVVGEGVVAKDVLLASGVAFVPVVG